MASFKCEGESGYKKPGRKKASESTGPYAKYGAARTHTQKEKLPQQTATNALIPNDT